MTVAATVVLCGCVAFPPAYEVHLTNRTGADVSDACVWYSTFHTRPTPVLAPGQTVTERVSRSIPARAIVEFRTADGARHRLVVNLADPVYGDAYYRGAPEPRIGGATLEFTVRDLDTAEVQFRPGP
ncbi:MAG: hypothetical protein A3K19_13630 [Lentisphaerae bacterium RIFOXYB12_FULL_65_16]|nr:MAG: hypothetical protein A3K18_30985 [Lentisphaerae bacterium RIFOXYA12_64_32]OGV86046.1 MAG: hypothetical protein A3K19_13630 [Lentisphaerae bacterium RIFOXYB12_FULL_65_16]